LREYLRFGGRSDIRGFFYDPTELQRDGLINDPHNPFAREAGTFLELRDVHRCFSVKSSEGHEYCEFPQRVAPSRNPDDAANRTLGNSTTDKVVPKTFGNLGQVFPNRLKVDRSQSVRACPRRAPIYLR